MTFLFNAIPEIDIFDGIPETSNGPASICGTHCLRVGVSCPICEVVLICT